MIHPLEDLMQRVRNPDKRMSLMLSGDDRFSFTLWLYCFYNPDITARDLAPIVVQALEGSENYPSLIGIYDR